MNLVGRTPVGCQPNIPLVRSPSVYRHEYRPTHLRPHVVAQWRLRPHHTSVAL